LGTKLKCKSDQEIDDFIDQIDVTGFSITEKIDFSKYKEKPVHSIIKKNFNKYLDSKRRIGIEYLLREN
jgi:hypothetical protein